MDIEWITGRSGAHILTDCVTLTVSGKCGVAAPLAEKLLERSAFVRFGRVKGRADQFVLAPCDGNRPGRLHLRKTGKQRSYSFDGRSKLQACGIEPKASIPCPAHWDEEQQLLIFTLPDGEKGPHRDTEKPARPPARPVRQSPPQPAIRNPQSEIGIAGTCRDCYWFTAKGVRGLGECGDHLSPKFGAVAATMTCHRFRPKAGVASRPEPKRATGPGSRITDHARRVSCPVCGRQIAVYAWRNGRAKLRPHQNPDGDKCAGNQEWFEVDE